MNSGLFALWAIVGWCGTGYPWWWWRFPPPPPPDPEPWWRYKLLGVIAGVVGGWAFTEVFNPEPSPWTVVSVAATTVGAFAASRLVSELYGLSRGGPRAARG